VHYNSDGDRASEVVESIRASGGIGRACRADVVDRTEVEAMVAACSAELGPIDILVNGARRMADKKPFLELEWSDYEPQLEIIVKGAFNCCQAVLPGMIERKHGRIINMMSAILHEPDWRWHSYGAAKSALFSMSRNLAAEMGQHGITVNMVAPGFVRTEKVSPHSTAYEQDYLARTPMGRHGIPEDSSKVVAFLAGDDAFFVTGANIPVSGGKIMT
jgi:3-oxoacyl-[acyl-carrier protein] reductase